MVMSLEIEGLTLEYNVFFPFFIKIKSSMIKNILGELEMVDQLVALE